MQDLDVDGKTTLMWRQDGGDCGRLYWNVDMVGECEVDLYFLRAYWWNSVINVITVVMFLYEDDQMMGFHIKIWCTALYLFCIIQSNNFISLVNKSKSMAYKENLQSEQNLLWRKKFYDRSHAFIIWVIHHIIMELKSVIKF